MKIMRLFGEFTFSGVAAFSYVWHKEKKTPCFQRFCFSLHAGVIGCIFGYKVSVLEVNDYLNNNKYDDRCKSAYFNKEFKKKLKTHDIKNRPIYYVNKKQKQKINKAKSRYSTYPHEGELYRRCSGVREKYITSDVKGINGEKTVKIEIDKSPSLFIKYDYVKTDSNIIAFKELNNIMSLSLKNTTGPELYNVVSEKICEKYDTRKGFISFPEFIFINGVIEKQHQYVKDNTNDHTVVVLNDSKINYKNQIDETSKIWENSSYIKKCRYFGAATVKSEKGGVEFLAHTLTKNDEVEFSGAFYDFFSATSNDDKLHANGGDYRSSLDEVEWYKLIDELINSDTKTEGFCWGIATKDKDGHMKIYGKKIYQIGAINALRSCYGYPYKQCSPPPFLQFLMFFYQIRNALMHETNTQESIVVHATALGENDAFGNKENVSMMALKAAIMSLPFNNKEKIKNVFFGSL